MTVSVDKKTLKIIFSICVLAVAICIAVCVSEIRATADYSKADGTLVSNLNLVCPFFIAVIR